MLGIDTNVAVHAVNTASSLHRRAYDFVASLGPRRDVAICELMLVELNLKLPGRRRSSRRAPARAIRSRLRGMAALAGSATGAARRMHGATHARRDARSAAHAARRTLVWSQAA